MKVLHSIICVVIFPVLVVILTGCSTNADWNSAFVVWNGDMYEVSNEYVEETDKEIGRVTKYSEREGTYLGNFSNTYSKGTAFYSIKGINTDEAIAIEEDEKYRKAINNGKYGEK